MPEVEDLAIHLATLFKIDTAKHSLIQTSTEDLAYFTKRFESKKRKEDSYRRSVSIVWPFNRAKIQ